MTKTKWIRVSKNFKCAICDHAEWCTFSEDGKVACCMRVQSEKTMHNGGYLHKLSEDRPKYIPPLKQQQEVKIDAEQMWNEWHKKTTPKSLELFAEKLGVWPLALFHLDCVWAFPHNAWCFPMKDAKQKKIGIRLRSEQGEKWAVTGSRAGLFIPCVSWECDELLICEGPTDAAAALSIGYYAIGRPSCLGCETMICDFIKLNKFKKVIIVADNDDPGINGAKKLQKDLPVSSCLVTLPTKDLRQFVIQEGTKEVLECIIKALVWTKK